MRSGGFAYLVVLCSFRDNGSTLDFECTVGVNSYFDRTIADVDDDESTVSAYVANPFLFYVSNFVDGYDLLSEIIMKNSLSSCVCLNYRE